MTKNSTANPSRAKLLLETLAYGALTVLGFSFWFWMAVPFASHRESYMWLGYIGAHWTLVDFLTFSTSTYRPLSQGLMGLVYIWTRLGTFPSSMLVQGVVQVAVYACYVIAWLALYQKHPQRRSLALWAAPAGLVFFTPYAMLFHPWGLFYIPVIGVLAWLTRQGENSVSLLHFTCLVICAVIFLFWHPFASALILAYLGTDVLVDLIKKRQLSAGMFAQVAGVIGLALAILLTVSHIPAGYYDSYPSDAQQGWFAAQLSGALASYETIEVNHIVSVVAMLFALTTAWSVPIEKRWRGVCVLAVGLICLLLVKLQLPLLLAWLAIALVKLLFCGRWRLAAMLAAAGLFPLGGGIGAPIYGLFAVILACYASAIDEPLSSWVSNRMSGTVAAAAVAAVMLIALAERWIDLPGLTTVARPLLAEKDHTYQLEAALQFIASSKLCSRDISFVESANPPRYSMNNVLERSHRPPSSLGDVSRFWATARCSPTVPQAKQLPPLLLTFGDQHLACGTPVFEVSSRFAEHMIVYDPSGCSSTPKRS
jgi:hypothetical protein